MHIVSRIASILRVDPSHTPKLPQEFYPLPFSRYITIYNEQIVPANTYDYFNDVIFDISPILKQNDIKIIQFLNSPNDRRLINCFYIEKFSFPQMNYLIKNSLLHLCTDTYTNEVCGVFSVPSICLVGNRYPDNSSPWYSNPENNFVLGGPINDRASFAFNESPKSINKIKTEEISKKIAAILGVNVTQDYETLFVGSAYHEKTTFDVIPNVEVGDPILNNADVCIRFDKFHNEKNCIKFCARNKFSLIVDRKTSDNFISACKKNCAGVSFIVDTNTDIEDVRFFINNGLSVKLISHSEHLSEKLILKFLDFGQIHVLRPEVDSKQKEILTNIPFRSSKIIWSQNNKYPSYAHLEKGLKIGIINKTINSKSFWQDSCRYKIYKETK